MLHRARCPARSVAQTHQKRGMPALDPLANGAASANTCPESKGPCGGALRLRMSPVAAITARVYVQLLPGYLREEIDRLSFGPRPVSGESFPSRGSPFSGTCRCGRGENRTHYPRLRRPVLYPSELRARVNEGALYAAPGPAKSSHRRPNRLPGWFFLPEGPGAGSHLGRGRC